MRKQTTKGAVTLMSIVTLLTELVEALSKSEQNFITNLKDFYSLETSVKESTEAFAVSFLICSFFLKQWLLLLLHQVIRTEEKR